MRPEGNGGDSLYDGNKNWRLHFDAGGLPPVDGFWSLSMYERTAGGQSFFTNNALKRYAIGNRTPGLKTNGDGSTDIWITQIYQLAFGRTRFGIASAYSVILFLVMMSLGYFYVKALTRGDERREG